MFSQCCSTTALSIGNGMELCQTPHLFMWQKSVPFFRFLCVAVVLGIEHLVRQFGGQQIFGWAEGVSQPGAEPTWLVPESLVSWELRLSPELVVGPRRLVHHPLSCAYSDLACLLGVVNTDMTTTREKRETQCDKDEFRVRTPQQCSKVTGSTMTTRQFPCSNFNLVASHLEEKMLGKLSEFLMQPN